MNVFRFLEWPVYKDAKRLNIKIGAICKALSIDLKKKYGDQFNRAALSVCLNIAEGAGRYSDAELCRHFDIALGSLAETVACADNLCAEGYLNQSQFDEIYKASFGIETQLQAMKLDAFRHPRKFKKPIEMLE